MFLPSSPSGWRTRNHICAEWRILIDQMSASLGKLCQNVDLLYLNEWCIKITGWIKETCVSTNACKHGVMHTQLSLSHHQHGAVTSQYHMNEAIRAAEHSSLPSSGPITGSRHLTKEPNKAALSQTSSSVHPSIFFAIERSITLMTPRSHKRWDTIPS